MKIKLTNPKHIWHHEFRNHVFEVLDTDIPDHHQYPVTTRYGQTWFDKDACTVVEN